MSLSDLIEKSKVSLTIPNKRIEGFKLEATGLAAIFVLAILFAFSFDLF